MSSERYSAQVDWTDTDGNRCQVEVSVTLTEAPKVYVVEDAMQRCVGAIMGQMTGEQTPAKGSEQA